MLFRWLSLLPTRASVRGHHLSLFWAFVPAHCPFVHFRMRHVAAAAVDARLSPSSNPSLALQTTSQRGIRPPLPSSHSTSQRLRFDVPCLWLRIRRTAQRVVGWGNVF
ncbi:uncharacterized protein LACBIDRAFT_304760 [Laccaria bicolor S238N-H82]|uniref:Predicted protein n=1 Tax=Laccaria bicolor (strain S238N-H82 / ATCC MYA-4686) TaxID=486041 RepID=B0DM98_LACBS|nr:uncharacterized protein LACBIDRAFT_304760 [Laccaria bicolor S238N-H82]EDR04158.1 predicted protein [Laccaria bicolor S238N-H82]|eukprot:XP_001885049.1 predicted protein [Laccaria bicolor S238N-H82]